MSAFATYVELLRQELMAEEREQRRIGLLDCEISTRSEHDDRQVCVCIYITSLSIPALLLRREIARRSALAQACTDVGLLRAVETTAQRGQLRTERGVLGGENVA